MPKKTVRAGTGAIGTGLKDHDEVSRLRIGQFHRVRKNIQRGAQRPHNRRAGKMFRIHPVSDGNGVILAYDLPKISRCREVVVLFILCAIVKSDSGSAPDISDSAVIESLMKEKRILRRGELVVNTVDDIRPIGATLFAVTLEEGEYIYFTWVNLSATKTDCKVYELYEYRKLSPSG